jgi:hypothetical protein
MGFRCGWSVAEQRLWPDGISCRRQFSIRPVASQVGNMSPLGSSFLSFKLKLSQ